MAGSNGTTARTLLDAVVAKDLATASRIFTEDVIVHVGGISELAGTYKGREEFFGAMGAVEQRTGGTITRTVHDVTESDGHAVGLMHVVAEPSGKRLTWNTVSVMHIEGEQVVEAWLFPDNPVAESEAFS